MAKSDGNKVAKAVRVALAAIFGSEKNGFVAGVEGETFRQVKRQDETAYLAPA